MSFPTESDLLTIRAALAGIQAAQWVSECQNDLGMRDGPGWNFRDGVWMFEVFGREVWPYDGSETVVLSTGYADIFPSGDVVQHGLVTFTVELD